MWVSGIMQGLMWREYDEQGFLVYSFAETVAAMHPYYLIRALGGALYLAGALIMAFNVSMTIRGDQRDEEPIGGRNARPAARGIRTHEPCRCSTSTHLIERNATLLLVGSLLVVTIGGIVEIAPLFYLENTIEKVEGMRPYTPLELAGRNIYVREGCYVCHSQMIRPFRDEVERYGHYSLAAESMYDHPFQWGSKRTGPDLARVGDRYSDEWHVQHLIEPRSVVPESIMPSYALPRRHAARRQETSPTHLDANARVGVPYTRRDDRQCRGRSEGAGRSRTPTPRARGALPKGQARRLRRRSGRPLTEMDALVAYLQMLGTLVDFSTYDEAAGYR